ncbi:type III secretion system export apparatus subunit SctV [Paraburkholderia youngii]|uniref:type III secretion system export apparatus subunit SctV n=1 Tax=Paraburkholderia youngii TaxID=2782701 RepID=UPI003D21055C
MFKSIKMPVGGEAAIAALVVAIISLMILPLPTLLIDGLLAINITLSVTLLMVTMYVPTILQLSAFPSMLLFTTLFRLSLNIASTKSILLHADAGRIIESFGELVVGGNLVVGLVVFLIITTVQFIVIAKGSERVAEVGARFTLDAMPGKQMSIDADLRANLLTGEEARKKRAMLALESQLHGGMDGAMKFVKGDAIAGLVITMVNIFAGIAVGVAYHGMSAGEAANRFSILSIGDAMVSQIASLLISVAAGVMITRVSDEHEKGGKSLGEQIGSQLGGNSRALFVAALLLVGFAAVPGFPAPLFLLLAALLAFIGYRLEKRKSASDVEQGGSAATLQRAGAKGESPAILAKAPQFAAPLGVRVSEELAAYLSPEILDRAFGPERRRIQEELGLPFPGITLWRHDDLKGSSYEILLHDVPSASSELPTHRSVVLEADETLRAQCDTVNSVGGMATSLWIDTTKLPASGVVSLNAEQVMSRHVANTLRRNAHVFIGIQETAYMLEQCALEYPGLVEEVKKALATQKIADVLRRLLEEQISIRNIRNIFESLVTWGPKEKDMLMLTEYVRGDLGRMIAHRATGGAPQLPAIVLDLQVEQLIRQSIKQTPTGNFLALPPEQINAFVGRLEAICGGVRPDIAVVTSMDIRRYFRRMIEARLSWLQVYSFQELGGHVQLKPVGKLAL